ncbi:hydroxymethylbilane synthase [Desulforamulus reducens MI-1]|uniref:Porphobilinogen deaminase n=1 Tax=Desulforamulus reducens (strain ATCC BAA-1160 / DSM 100696 / MI-1) TaxID=349161 RepID=HEM3_DESRM|nr:hydroxymethylbilane synthase [Desulforamulus reducens]A4J6H7.1 RecName: Full=Porphobilinogen deaminase; Short=PBG; AltName: Full=Hydroxymethylbilane synthase; Short=HMBS; AltName: Full=Pre-uroporphyrinogen synthase [Desulforamulus reducens MI-1]ABO50680.1 hydroxymethylbilane synthase [Desulforamulus reducens MI-1]
MKHKITVGSRDSALALWQTRWVVEQLEKQNPDVTFEITTMKTKGDKMLDVALAKIGDKGLFTKELEVAMLQKEIDFAVHSLKDMPTALPEGLIIGAVCKRDNPGDALISKDGRKLDELPKGARIGTSSLRRCAQLLNYRPDFQLEALRGNLNTRMKKLVSEQLDGIILAAAGITRMGWEDMIAEIIPFQVCLPAVGQGAISVECREDDPEILNLLKGIEHTETKAATEAERSLLRYLEGGCQVPIGAHSEVKNNRLMLTAVVATLDGTKVIRAQGENEVNKAVELGIEVAEKLMAMGGKKILEEVRAGE